MLAPEKRISEYISKIEGLLGHFEEGSIGLVLSTEDEAEYRQVVMEVVDFLDSLLGTGNSYSANLVSAVNQGVGPIDGGPTYAGVQAALAVLRAARTKLQQQIPSPIESNATELLRVLAAQPREPGRRVRLGGTEIAEMTGLTPDEINDGATLLVESGLAEWQKALGTAPYSFMRMSITPRGRYELERLNTPPPLAISPAQVADSVFKPPTPIGSPYGFTDEDWETAAARRSEANTVYVVLGHQFDSENFNSDLLRKNVQSTFVEAVAQYNAMQDASPVTLHFESLSAGYGEHLFNEIARLIIAADIAVFDTSDLNPNVMLEMGVALTWGVRVLPIKAAGCPKPPSDVSGQTWADYRSSAESFVDPDHLAKLVRMVERAARKKGRSSHVR